MLVGDPTLSPEALNRAISEVLNSTARHRLAASA